MAAEAYIQNGAGARGKALAGAGVASSTDATAAGLNPAGLTNVGTQLNASVSFLHLDGGYTAPAGGGINADGHQDSDPGWVVIPNLAVNWRVNSPLVDAIAFTAYGNGGVATHYDDVANANCPFGSGVFCGGPLGIKMAQSFYSVAFAKEISRGISVGVAPIFAHQQLKVEGGSAFPTLLPGIKFGPGEFLQQRHGPFVWREPSRRTRMENRAQFPCRRGGPPSHLHDQVRQVRWVAARAG
jgi:long-chain fatty acid transport protein